MDVVRKLRRRKLVKRALLIISIYAMGLSLSRSLDFNEFLETVIDRQGDTRDIYDEILQGFKMFDCGECCD